MSTFPILRLPSLAIEAVLELFRTFDVISFSRVSRNSRSVAIYYCKCRKSSLKIYARECLRVTIDSWDRFEYAITNVKMDEKQQLFCDSEKNPYRVWVYSENPVEKLKELTTELMQILGCSIQVVHISTDVLDVYKIVDWLKSVSNFYEKFLIHDDKDNSETTKYILESIKPTKKLYLFADNPTDGIIEKIPKNLKSITLRNSTFAQLQKLDGTESILVTNTLSHEDISAFLRSWMAMECHFNLKAFETVINAAQVPTILRDIPREVADLAKVKKRAWNVKNLIRAYDIIREDGTMATVYTRKEFLFLIFGLYVPSREEVDD